MSEFTADDVDPDVEDPTAVDPQGLADWCEATLNDADSDEAREAERTVAGRDDDGWVLHVAARMYEDEPDSLRSLRLSELDYLALVIAAADQGSLNEQDLAVDVARDSTRAARDLRERIVGHAADEQEAARMLYERAGDNPAIHVPPMGHLDRATIDEIESWASNAGTEMFEVQPGLWLLYDNVS
jgi:hypothetical protein